MPKSIRSDDHNVRREVNDAIIGDNIIIECRKPGKWKSIRGSSQHNYFSTFAAKNAYAVIKKKYKNVKQ